MEYSKEKKERERLLSHDLWNKLQTTKRLLNELIAEKQELYDIIADLKEKNKKLTIELYKEKRKKTCWYNIKRVIYKLIKPLYGRKSKYNN